jgi:soluble lytic murein transglycosylase-like protein
MLGGTKVSPDTLEPLINEMGLKYGVEPALIKAHIKQESNWDVNASRFEPHLNDSSWGLMQVLLTTAKEILGSTSLTASQLLDPRVNIEAGTAYIAKNMKRYGGAISDVIAAYNAGSARFLKNGYTYINQDYVDKVWKNYTLYKSLGTKIADVAIDVTNITGSVVSPPRLSETEEVDVTNMPLPSEIGSIPMYVIGGDRKSVV